jgi:hypothetical protein
VREDPRRMGVTNWRIRARRRDDWKTVVKEAKVLQGLWGHGVCNYITGIFLLKQSTELLTVGSDCSISNSSHSW